MGKFLQKLREIGKNWGWVSRSLVLWSVFLSFCFSAFAENAGQIINVNQSYQIAFTDLGSNVLKVGDIVRVSLDENEFLYMQVIECSSILSKLGVAQKDSYRTNTKNLSRISVGDAVVKVNGIWDEAVPSVKLRNTIEAIEPPPVDCKIVEQELVDTKIQMESLKMANRDLRARIDQLLGEIQMKEAEKCANPPKATGGSEEDLLELKTRLENMQRLMNQN